MSSSTGKHGHWWRPLVSGLCLALAGLSLIGSIVVRYTRDNLLNTDRFVEIIQPLPQDPAVASALATYTTNTLFDASHAETAIRDLLPPKLAPIAAPLTDTLQQKVKDTTATFVESDNFNAIWATAIRLAHQGVMTVATVDPDDQAGDRQRAIGSLDLGALVQTTRDRFGDEQAILGEEKPADASVLKINLRQNVEQLRWSVRAVNTAATALPLLTLGFLLAGIAVAYNRRRAVLAAGLTVLLVGVSMLIAFKVASTELLQTIHTALNRNAAAAIYEAFYDDLRSRLVAAVVVGGLVAVGALVAGPYGWAIWLRTKLRLKRATRTEPYAWAVATRRFMARFVGWLYAGGIAVAAIVLLMLSSVGVGKLLAVLGGLLAYLALVHIVAKPAPMHRP